MSKLLTSICASICAYSVVLLHADAPGEPMPDAMIEFPMLEVAQVNTLPLQEVAPVEIAIPEAPVATKKVVEKTPEINVNPFTGKIKARKVRMRLKPDLDSRIIKEVSKNEFVTVIGEKGDFWAVQAPNNTKAYVFRSFILDNVVEGNHVNVRLEPSLDAPVIAHLNSGDSIHNPSVSAINPKWVEIAPPEGTRFYIAKEYVDYAGGPEVKAKMDKRLQTAEQLLDGSALLSKAELKKPFEEIDFDRVVKGYHAVINDFSEFSDLVEQSKEALASFQEDYLQKKISHVEAQEALQYAAEAEKASRDSAVKALDPFSHVAMITDKMRIWEPLEEALYLSWSNINDNKALRDYYEEQKLAAVEISGIIEPYTTPVKSKPGDFILRENDIPVGYIYSTQVNLQNLVGTHVKLVAAPRPNNNFAFPAYYVLAVE